MKIISWNVRGLGLGSKKRSVEYFFDINRCDIVILQKTKLDYCSDIIVRYFLGNYFDE